ncbi:hypothetical protein AK812_SmicGene15559 [Symbiodinium microadriaticum]|uniref:Uncharacterized protein n=1 Tax=Symbiodinium microadriaticum TaxID=2951 RepID=A0A1Q9E2M7_SYMMI|nr:hypothetical protein AK812_SmicGene15559 [Symbiodinium microadriaticum]
MLIEKKYRQGNFFERGDYVWADALDLSLGQPELTFREVTSEEKQPAEVWAALKSDPGTAWFGSGPLAKGPGLYTVPKAPDEWKDRAELLDNNFRNLMKKDHNNDDKGEDYVKKANAVALQTPIAFVARNAELQNPLMASLGRPDPQADLWRLGFVDWK